MMFDLLRKYSWLIALLCLLLFVHLPASAQTTSTEVTTLTFQEFFVPNVSELRPSEKLLSLNGQRVRIAGFMAKMETPPAGAFYLCPRPVYADESGGGNGDLPVNAVRVEVPALKGQPAPFVPNAFAVIGVLEIGPRTEADGTVSAIRLILDNSSKNVPQNLPKNLEDNRPPRSGPPASKKPNHNLKTTIKGRK